MIILSLTNRLIGDYGVETDFYAAYVKQAKEILNGNLIIDNYRGPLYQILLAGLSFILSIDFFTAGKILNVISASITLVFVAKLIDSLIGREASFLTVIFVAVNQCFVKYTYTAGTDMLFFVFYTSALYFILNSSEVKSKHFLIAGILTSLAYLTRYTGISLIISTFLIMSIRLINNFKKSNNINNVFNTKYILAYSAPVILSIVIWGGICLQKTGSFFYNMNYKNTALTVYKPDDISKDEWTLKYQNSFNSMNDVVFKDFKLFVKKIFIDNFSSYFVKDITRLVPKIIGVLIFLGLVLFIFNIKYQNLESRFFLLSSFIFYMQILLIFYSERFSLPLLPFYIFLLINLFSIPIFKKYNLQIGKIKLFGIIVFILIIYNLINSFYIIKKDLNSGPKEILTIKKYVNDKLNEKLKGKLILARKPHIAYYLDMDFVETPFTKDYSSFIEVLTKKNIDYYFINEKESDNFPDENLRQKLLNINSPPEGLEIVTSTSNPISILYRVKK